MTRRRAKAEAPHPGAALLALAGREEPNTGLGWGSFIHRHHEPRTWPQQLERVPEALRAEAGDYLRGIAARMRAQLNMARAAGFRTMEEWKAARAKR